MICVVVTIVSPTACLIAVVPLTKMLELAFVFDIIMIIWQVSVSTLANFMDICKMRVSFHWAGNVSYAAYDPS